MAELTNFYDDQDTEQTHTGDEDFTTVPGVKILGSALTATNKYLIVARGFQGMNDTTHNGSLRVVTADDTNIEAKSEQRIEHSGTGADQVYFFAHSFTTSSSPVDVEFEFKSWNAGATVRADQLSLWLLDLTAIGSEGTAYFEDIQPVSADVISTNPATTALTQLSGSDLGTDEFLIAGYGRVDGKSTNKWWYVTMHAAADASTSSSKAFMKREGEDINERHLVGNLIRHKASSGTPNVTIYSEVETSSHTDGGGYLIALPTTLFADFKTDYEDGAVTANGETTVATIGSYTPTVTGNHLVFGRFESDLVGAGLMSAWVESTTTEIRTGDSALTHNGEWDSGKDEGSATTFQRYSITTAETLNLQGDRGIDAAVRRRWLVVVNLNPPATGAVEVTGTPEAAAEVSATAIQTHEPIVVSEVAAEATAAATLVYEHSAATEAVAEASGIADQIHTAAGDTEAAAETTATAVQTHEPAGAAEAAAETTAAATQTHTAAGTVEAAAEISGTLSVVSAGLNELTGTIEAAAESVGTAIQIQFVTATLEAAFEVSATADQIHAAVAVLEAAAEAVGVVTVITAVVPATEGVVALTDVLVTGMALSNELVTAATLTEEAKTGLVLTDV